MRFREWWLCVDEAEAPTGTAVVVEGVVEGAEAPTGTIVVVEGVEKGAARWGGGEVGGRVGARTTRVSRRRARTQPGLFAGAKLPEILGRLRHDATV